MSDNKRTNCAYESQKTMPELNSSNTLRVIKNWNSEGDWTFQSTRKNRSFERHPRKNHNDSTHSAELVCNDDPVIEQYTEDENVAREPWSPWNDIVQVEKRKDASIYLPKPSLAPKTFAKYFYNPHLSDAIIEVIRPGGTSINILISKLVVADRSPVFHKMFQAGMSEPKSSRITISDVSEASVRAMVEFAYTNAVSAELESADHRKQLYDLAEQYEMPGLSALAGR
ncbi:hypothetical protein SeMB42_g07474 [Synchytrium endobioticum]|uniref:BTB domain-containing protein n=1 Tax=Synchytrium endobioticum TaxID=286115 RepID=A0A507CZT4_9FUNG|nr:hypothetical protein SeMB42_g07474 [Synchytrium endobioticum]TPX44684.1 hypothetical protein SeLEV6574_g04339 [Synchytrium endobioticum]